MPRLWRRTTRRDELVLVHPDEHELHAPGQICVRCGEVIAARDEVRRTAWGPWAHQNCPVAYPDEAVVLTPRAAAPH